MLKKLFFLFTIWFQISVFAQTYPVQVTPQVIPPYSVKLSDYITTSNEKLYVNILLTDVNEVGRRIKLKMYIEGQGLSITTNDVLIGETPIYVDGGVNLRLTNLDLRPYFQVNNLTGITSQQYNTPLPNGGYDFCFEVYDYFTNRKLSSKSCTTIYLLQNDPPILNLPFRDNIVAATNPQNIVFTWTPRHTNATNVQYEFTLKELWDIQNPQANFLASIPFYQTTTQTTTLLVGPDAPQLLSGKMYGWQVRAFVSDGIEETSVFKNDGKSEIFWFKYLENCLPPSFVISQALNAESVRINWQISDHIKYQIQYRKKGFGDEDWFNLESYTNEGTIYSLEPNTVYEFRVGGECTPLSGYAYSNIQEFTTPSNDEAAYYNCGFTPQIDINNTEPLPTLKANDTFTAGDFPVVVREVTGSNGVFSGWGYITLPFLENIKEIIDAVNIATNDSNDENGKGGNVNIGKYTRIKVVFKSVHINTTKQLTQGVVETDYDPTWGGILDVDEVIDDIAGNDGAISVYDATNVDGLEDVKVTDNGDIILVLNDGTEIPIETDKPVVIKGTDKQWTVDEEGNVSSGTPAEGGTPDNNNTEGISGSGNVEEISNKDVQVTFTPSGFYGFDVYQTSIKSEKYKNEYEFIKTHDNKEYSVRYKLISDKPEADDVVKVNAVFSNGKTKDDIVFKTKQGAKVETTWLGNEATLQLKRTFNFAKDEILATVKPKDSTDKYTIAGKLNTWHVQQREINLTLISVNGASTSGVKERINEIYNKAGVHFKIDTVHYSTAITSLNNGDSDILANYTPEERGFINDFTAKNGSKKDQYYLFFIDKTNITLASDVEGFMPLKRQFGFVFTTQDPGRVAAHELGHGIFGLKHPFDQYNAENAKNENEYLMSYGTGIAFSHMDWQKLHAPGIQLYWFQDDEAGESTIVKLIPSEFKNSDGTYTFMTLNGSYITLPKGIKELTFSTGLDNFDKFIDYPIGALIKFKINDVTFSAEVNRSSNFTDITKEDLTFTYKGFKSLSDGHFYGTAKEEKGYNKFEDGKVIALIPHYTTKYKDPYNLSGTIESGYQLIKISREDLSFAPNTGEQVTFNLIDDYTSISKFFSNYRANPKPSKSYSYKETPFNSQFELQAEYVNPILKDFSWTNKHAILAKYAVLNNAQPELFKSFFKQKYGEKSYIDIFKELDIDKLKEIYIDLINSFSKERDSLIQELHNLLATVKVTTPSLVAVESVRINEILKQLTTEQITNYINPNQRETAIELLLFANGTHTDYGEDNGDITSITNKFDEQILKLVKFVKEGDEKNTLITLTQDDYKLFWESIKKLDEDIIPDFLNLYTEYVNKKESDRIKHRTDILTKLSDVKEDDWGNKTEKVFASIISNLENRSQDQADLVKYFESKPEVLKNAFSKLDNFVKVEELANFVFTICSWKVKLGDTSGINEEAFKEYAEVNYLAGTSYDAVKYIKPISQEHNYIPYFRESWIKSAQRGDNYYLDTKFTDNKINLELYRYGHEIINDSYSPLEYVYIHFREDSSYKTHQFKKGTGLKVPAIFIHWLDDSVDDDQNMAVARVVGNILAIVAAPSTFGASLAPFVVNVEVAANLIDIYVTVNRQELIDTGLQEELAYWDAAFAIYSLKDLPDAIIGLGRAGKGFINTIDNIAGAIQQNRTILKSENLNNAVDAFHAIESTAKKEEVIKALDEMLYVLKYKNPQKLDPVSKLINYRTYFKFRTKLVTEFKKGAPTIIDIEASGVDFKPSLIYTNGGSKVNLGTLEFNSSNVLVLSDSKRLLPSGITNTEELATIKNVLVETAAGSKGIKNISVVKNLDDGEIYLSLVGGLREDIIKLQVDELLALRDIHNPNKLNHNCFTCAIKYQNEFTKGTNEVIEEIAKKYHAGVAPEEINKLIYDVFGFDNIKIHNALDFDNLTIKLSGIHQESVILVGKYEEDFIEDFTSHHAFNARRVANREWEIIDIQNGAKYDKTYIDDKFTSIEVFEVLYKDHTYISRNNLKRDLPKEIHVWVDNMPKEFLNTLEGLPYTKLQQFVREFDNKVEILSEFNKDPLLFKVWETMERSPNIPVSIRTKIANLQGAKRVICK
ncbi:hypothetical protein ACQY1Q_02010 [Tenacibaculum sp. TC6]